MGSFYLGRNQAANVFFEDTSTTSARAPCPPLLGRVHSSTSDVRLVHTVAEHVQRGWPDGDGRDEQRGRAWRVWRVLVGREQLCERDHGSV